MITIFHGDNYSQSRDAVNNYLNDYSGEVFRLDAKSLNINSLANLLTGTSMFGDQKTILISGFFSLPALSQKKYIALINSSNYPLILWADKKLSPTQLKNFQKPKINDFPLSRQMFSFIYGLRPKNTKDFSKKFDQITKNEPFELFFYLLKKQFRTQNTKIYLQLIDLEFQIKSGQINQNKELALKNLLVNFIK